MPMASLSLLPVAAGGLTDVDFQVFVWTLVLFALFAFVLGRFGWKPLLGLIEERERNVREAVEGAQKANSEAQELLEQHREMVRDAGREREEILQRAAKEAEKIKEDIVSTARSEGDRLVRRAKEQIEREKGQALQELREQVADIAVEAASKIVESSLTPDAQRKLVDDFIESLPRVS